MTITLSPAADRSQTLLIGLCDRGRTASTSCIGPDGASAPTWLPFLDKLESIGADGRAAIARTTEQKLLESGIAFNVHADPDDRQAAWRLDLLPVILDADGLAGLEAGLIQRARLIEAALAGSLRAAAPAAFRRAAAVADLRQSGVSCTPAPAGPSRPSGTSSHLRLRRGARSRMAAGGCWPTRSMPRPAMAGSWPAGWR